MAATLHLRLTGARLPHVMRRATDVLSLGAAPVFALMALGTAVQAGPLHAICAVAPPLGGMVPMYLLMSCFHAGPWLRLVSALLAPGTAQAAASEMNSRSTAA